MGTRLKYIEPVASGCKSARAGMMNKRKFGTGRGFPPRGKGLSSRSPPPEKRSRRDNTGNASQGEFVVCFNWNLLILKRTKGLLFL